MDCLGPPLLGFIGGEVPESANIIERPPSSVSSVATLVAGTGREVKRGKDCWRRLEGLLGSIRGLLGSMRGLLGSIRGVGASAFMSRRGVCGLVVMSLSELSGIVVSFTLATGRRGDPGRLLDAFPILSRKKRGRRLSPTLLLRLMGLLGTSSSNL